jgi:hypothetical protein
MEAESGIMETKTTTHRISRRLCRNNASYGETTQHARAVSGGCGNARLASKTATACTTFEGRDSGGNLEAARVSEVAHSANTTTASQMETLTAKVDLLLTNMVANKNEESTTTPKKVTFTQAVVAAETTNRPNRERPYSPAGRSPSRSPVRSSDGYQSSAGPLRREWSDNDRPFRRETDRRREMTQDRQRSTSRRPAFNGQSPAKQQQNGPFYNQQFQRQPRYNTALQQRLSGNCKFCGGSHQLGRQFCPAANVQCFNCAKIGHMAKVCRSRSAAQGYASYNTQ